MVKIKFKEGNRDTIFIRMVELSNFKVFSLSVSFYCCYCIYTINFNIYFNEAETKYNWRQQFIIIYILWRRNLSEPDLVGHGSALSGVI